LFTVYAYRIIGTALGWRTPAIGHDGQRLQSPFAADLFFLFRSTGSKQTLNGLFYVKSQSSFLVTFEG
jgi:hypothetical protein